MSAFGAGEALLLLLGAVLAGALLIFLPQWRRLMQGGPELPVNRYLEKPPPFEAEVRCAFCSGREECLWRGKPLPDCPNLELLEKRKAL